MQKHKIRINPKSTGDINSGRPPKNLPDANKDEVYTTAPPPPECLINQNARDLWVLSADILCKRKQLKPAHLCLLINYCNSFAVTVMTAEEMVKYGIAERNEDGLLRPAMNAIYATYYNSMKNSMQMLRLDPKTELYNALAVQTEQQGTHEFGYVDSVIESL